MITKVTGRILFRRRLSARLVFYDITPTEPGCEGIELALKAGEGLDADTVKSLRDIVKLGDVVSATGELDTARHMLLVHSLDILERWQEARPGQHFRPEVIVHRPAQEHHDNDRLPAVQDRSELPAKASGVCKFWLNTGTCLKGEICRHAHPAEHSRSQERTAWISARRRNRRQAAADAGDPHGSSAAHKSHRAGIFCDWLIDTYGAEYLSQGSGVLDVAGGRGEVAFILHTLKGIRTTLIDPRPQKLSKRQHAQLQGFAGPEPTGAHAAVWIARQDGMVMERRSLQDGRLLPGLLPDQILQEFGPSLWQGGQHGLALQQCSLVVGLHPDQATDAISDFAVELGKAHAIVPCCVFPRQFPHRRIPQDVRPVQLSDSPIKLSELDQQRVLQEDFLSVLTLQGAANSPVQSPGSPDEGSALVPVVSHQQLVMYLQSRAGPAARTEFLKFEGMNQVVFSIP